MRTDVVPDRSGLPQTGSGVRGWVCRHPLVAFFMLAYTLSWVAWLPAVFGVGGTATIAGGFGPLIAALVVKRPTGESVRCSAGPFDRAIGEGAGGQVHPADR